MFFDCRALAQTAAETPTPAGAAGNGAMILTFSVATLLLLVGSAFFSASETALTASSWPSCAAAPRW